MIPERPDRQQYMNLLAAVARGAGDRRDRKLTLFASARGDQSADGLMVVGRAVNDWGSAWHADELRDPARQADEIGRAFTSADDALLWIDATWKQGDRKSRSNSSAFLRTARQTCEALGLLRDHTGSWADRIIWTNLYKVAPKGGGNPSGRLQRIQRPNAVALFRQEIDQWKPPRVLFLTGWDWAEPFLAGLTVRGPFPRPPGVKAVRQLEYGGVAVVCPHPQGKNERLIVEGAIAAFRDDGISQSG